MLTALAALLISSAPSAEQEQEQAHLPSTIAGFVDWNLYHDTRAFSVLTTNILVQLPWRLHYFSFTNLVGGSADTSPVDLETFYTEQNLRWGIQPNIPLDLTFQWVIGSGPDNDALRLGVRYRIHDTPGLNEFLKKLAFQYAINIHLGQFDFIEGGGWRWQIEHVYRWDVFPEALDRRLYFSGFLDQNLWFFGPASAKLSSVITENQVGIRLVAGLHAIAELRYREGGSKPLGAGFGLQYFLRFGH